MVVSIDIRPSSSTICLLNDPDPSTAYSLSGHVSLTISYPTSSTLDSPRGRVPKILLRSLNLVFEGQQEFLTAETGYASARLCRLSRQLVPVHAMMLSADEPDAAQNGSATWNFVFDLSVPGWLPASSIYGSDVHGAAGTTYALYAEAKYIALEEPLHCRSWSLSTLYSPFSSRVRTVRASRTVIDVVRYTLPPTSESFDGSLQTTFPDSMFTIDTKENVRAKNSKGPAIPNDILQSIEVIASIPECVDLDDGELKLVLRLRAAKLPTEQQRRLRLTHFRVQFLQHETYRRQPTQAYASNFPLPAAQPDTKPLIHTHEMKYYYELGFSSMVTGEANRLRASFSLLPQKKMAGRHTLPDGGVLFAQEAHSERENTWCRVDVSVPFERFERGQHKEWEESHGRVKMLRADEHGPLFYVHHELEVELTCTYDSEKEGEAPAVERLLFAVPVKFVRRPRSPACKESRHAMNDASSCASACGELVLPAVLPAYSQLYHSNGERKIDESVPLPLYTPFEPSNPYASGIFVKPIEDFEAVETCPSPSVACT